MKLNKGTYLGFMGNTSAVSTSNAASANYCACFDDFRRIIVVTWIILGLLLLTSFTIFAVRFTQTKICNRNND